MSVINPLMNRIHGVTEPVLAYFSIVGTSTVYYFHIYTVIFFYNHGMVCFWRIISKDGKFWELTRDVQSNIRYFNQRYSGIFWFYEEYHQWKREEYSKLGLQKQLERGCWISNKLYWNCTLSLKLYLHALIWSIMTK